MLKKKRKEKERKEKEKEKKEIRLENGLPVGMKF